MEEPEQEYESRLEAALNGSDPLSAAAAFAVQLRDGGMSQESLLGIFDAARAS
jgi:hypothetical protein